MAAAEFGPTLFVVTAVMVEMEKHISEFHILSDPRDLPDYVEEQRAELKSQVLEMVRVAFKADDIPEILVTGFEISLRTIGDLAKRVYPQEKCAGGPLSVLNKGEGWVRWPG